MYHTNAHKIKLKFALRREKKRKKGIHRPTSEKNRQRANLPALAPSWSARPPTPRGFRARPTFLFSPLLLSRSSGVRLSRRPIVRARRATRSGFAVGAPPLHAPNRRPAAPVLHSCAPPAQPRRFFVVSMPGQRLAVVAPVREPPHCASMGFSASVALSGLCARPFRFSALTAKGFAVGAPPLHAPNRRPAAPVLHSCAPPAQPRRFFVVSMPGQRLAVVAPVREPPHCASMGFSASVALSGLCARPFRFSALMAGVPPRPSVLWGAL